jgi:hypothetical protein
VSFYLEGGGSFFENCFVPSLDRFFPFLNCGLFFSKLTPLLLKLFVSPLQNVTPTLACRDTQRTFLLDYPPTFVTLRDKPRRLNVDEASDSEPILKNGKEHRIQDEKYF